jgi:hypothetical protein
MGVSDPSASQARRGRRWDASVLVALASVAVALVYNAVQAHDSAQQVEVSQRALQLSTKTSQLTNLLELHRQIVDADRKTTDAYLATLEPGGARRKTTRLVQAITPLEGIAYALRHDLIGMRGATGLWRRYLICAFYTARAGVGHGLDDYVPELDRFARSEKASLRESRGCVQVRVP